MKASHPCLLLLSQQIRSLYLAHAFANSSEEVAAAASIALILSTTDIAFIAEAHHNRLLQMLAIWQIQHFPKMQL